MNEQVKNTVFEIARDMINDPTVTYELFRGMNETTSDDDAENRTFEPTQGRTLVIHVHGGANNVQVIRVKTEDDEQFEEQTKELKDGARKETKGRRR